MRKRLEATRQALTSDDDRGAVLFILMIFLVIFIAVAALAVDLAATGARGQELQNASDAAALAAVVEYQDQILAGAFPTDDATRAQAQTAAEELANEVLAQNGIDPNAVVVTVEVGEGGTQLTVSITDNNPDEFLPESILGDVIKPGGPRSVQRQATAEIVLCSKTCVVEIDIPKPFVGVGARGTGDGYKPILVDNRLYAINHNSESGEIVCIDRLLQEHCWPDGAARRAYDDSVGYRENNPEMPHVAVVDGVIYWAATDSANGLRLFCFVTITDVPCPTAYTIDSSLKRIRIPGVNAKDENRGGGTVAMDDKVYVFADNHRIHCYDPAIDGACEDPSFAIAGNDTALAQSTSVGPDFFPSDPRDGNHGSSIDRIVDENSGHIFSTIHVPNAQPVGECPELAIIAGEQRVIQNALTGKYLALSLLGDVTLIDEAEIAESWWNITNADDGSIAIESVAYEGQYIDAALRTSEDAESAFSRWFVRVDRAADEPDPDARGNFLDSAFEDDTGGLRENGDGDLVLEDPTNLVDGQWQFKNARCNSGTWLHCYDTGSVSKAPGPCPDFAVNGIRGTQPGRAVPIHLDGSRASGRLWFYYSGGPNPRIEGVCSSGYRVQLDDKRTRDPRKLEVVCVDNETGNYESVQTKNMRPVAEAIQANTGAVPGAWGDPHWNQAENRLFYPTEHVNRPRIICYDFDDGYCGAQEGIVDIPATETTPAVRVRTEDYGFVSVGTCVFALGHNAYFWAFSASDPGERCAPQPAPTTITRCDCAGTDVSRWGVLDFREIDLSVFTSFRVRVLTDESATARTLFPKPDPDFPSASVWHSIKPGNAAKTIDLDDESLITIDPDADTVTVQVSVEGFGLEDIDDTLGAFEIRFPQTPKLVE